jgi:hypothetical protein
VRTITATRGGSAVLALHALTDRAALRRRKYGWPAGETIKEALSKLEID